MNSWNPNQNQNMVVGQANFNPYQQQTMWGNYRAPVYRADPIHGENAAWQFPIGAGEIYLPDADEDIIWWIRVDQNGVRTVTPFDVIPHKQQPQIDVNELAAKVAALEEWVNGKQNKSNAKRNSTNTIDSNTIQSSN